ncbi:hypothetical protein MRX96_043804, partial [Rhipicephalus microplus]
IIIGLLVDKQNPNRPIYTFVASAWKALSGAQEVSAKDATNNFKKVLMPDLFISIGHYAFHDINMLEKCRLLPATYLQPPQLDSNEQYKYTFGLESATKHVTDIDKLRDKGVEAPSLSVSVGLYGRWHYVDSKAGTKLEDHRPGSQCRPVVTKTQKTGIYEVCVMNKRECLVNFVVYFVSYLHVAMRCFCGVNERVYVNDHPNRCPRCSTRCLCYNRLDGTVPPFGPADSFVDVSTSC